MGNTSKDFLDVIEIGRIALECDSLVEIRQEVIKRVASAFGVEKSNFWMYRQYPFPHLDLNDVVYEDIDEEDIRRFVRYYHKMDPYNNYVGVEGGVYSLSSQELQELTKGEYYNEFLVPQNIHYQLSVYFRAHGTLLGVMGMYRAKSTGAFSPRELNKARVMANFVSAGLERAVLNQKVKKVEDVISAVCPDLPYNWVMVLDERLDPIYVNPEALKAMSGVEVNTAVNGHAYSVLPEELSVKFREFSEAAKKSRDPEKQAVIRYGNGAGGKDMSANIRWTRSQRDSQLMFVVAGKERTISPAAFKRFGLSRREAEIAGLICDGLKNKEIGEKLFISEYTVENHLRSIYRKMNVCNRTSLVHRLTFSREEL